MSVLAVTVVVGLGGCGGSGASDVTIATIGASRITKATLDRWTPIEARLAYNGRPSGPIPAGVVPDPPVYTKCIAFMKSTSPKGTQPPSPAVLKDECAKKLVATREHMLELLIDGIWLEEETKAKGIKLPNVELQNDLNEYITREYGTRETFLVHLRRVGMTMADELVLIRKNALATKIIEAAIGSADAHSAAQQKQLGRVLTVFERKWKSRTYCRPGYVISVCAQYKEPGSAGTSQGP